MRASAAVNIFFLYCWFCHKAFWKSSLLFLYAICLAALSPPGQGLPLPGLTTPIHLFTTLFTGHSFCLSLCFLLFKVQTIVRVLWGCWDHNEHGPTTSNPLTWWAEYDEVAQSSWTLDWLMDDSLYALAISQCCTFSPTILQTALSSLKAGPFVFNQLP